MSAYPSPSPGASIALAHLPAGHTTEARLIKRNPVTFADSVRTELYSLCLGSRASRGHVWRWWPSPSRLGVLAWEPTQRKAEPRHLVSRYLMVVFGHLDQAVPEAHNISNLFHLCQFKLSAHSATWREFQGLDRCLFHLSISNNLPSPWEVVSRLFW